MSMPTDERSPALWGVCAPASSRAWRCCCGSITSEIPLTPLVLENLRLCADFGLLAMSSRSAELSGIGLRRIELPLLTFGSVGEVTLPVRCREVELPDATGSSSATTSVRRRTAGGATSESGRPSRFCADSVIGEGMRAKELPFPYVGESGWPACCECDKEREWEFECECD